MLRKEDEWQKGEARERSGAAHLRIWRREREAEKLESGHDCVFVASLPPAHFLRRVRGGLRKDTVREHQRRGESARDEELRTRENEKLCRPHVPVSQTLPQRSACEARRGREGMHVHVSQQQQKQARGRGAAANKKAEKRRR